MEKKLLRVAVTGVFGSGKTTVSSFFMQEGIPVISCDAIVHQLLARKKTAEKIKSAFGESFIKNGSVDRKKLAELVFSDVEKRMALEKLLHPAVFREIKKNILDYEKKGGIIVVEIPLLFETKSENLFNKIVVVASSPEKIKQRLKEKFQEEEIEIRWRNQIPLIQKEKKADYIIDNSGSEERTRRQVKQLIKELKNKEKSWKTQ